MKYLFLIYLICILQPAFSQKPNTSNFLANSNSILQFYEYERAIQRNEEIVALYFAMGSADWKDDRTLIKDAIEQEKKLKKKVQNALVDKKYVSFKNNTLYLIDTIIFCFNNLYNYGPESEEFKKSNEIYQPMLQAHLETFFSYFGSNSYISIDSTIFARERARIYGISFPRKKEADDLLQANKPYQAYQLIKNNCMADICLVYLADIVLKKKYSDSVSGYIDNTSATGLHYLALLISKNAYNPYLYEGWRKWRAISQNGYGASKTSEIPNEIYDSVRFKLAKIISEHIKKEPADIWGYIQFFSLMDAEIIHRFGDYPYGNQSAVERNELFYKD